MGLLVAVPVIRRGWFTKKKLWDFPPRETWDADWSGTLEGEAAAAAPAATMSTLRAWSPYAIVAILLLITRIPGLGIRAWLSGVSIGPSDLFGTGIGQTVQPFYLPGFMFLVTCFLTYGLHGMSRTQILGSWRLAGSQLLGAAVALIFAVPMVRVFIQSRAAYNNSGLESMPLLLAETAAALVGGAWPLVAPWIGAMGAFVAGSNTISNLMFSLFQFSTAQRIEVLPTLIVAAQAVGGAASNMVTVHNVVAASATVGLMGREGSLIRKTIILHELLLSTGRSHHLGFFASTALTALFSELKGVLPKPKSIQLFSAAPFGGCLWMMRLLPGPCGPGYSLSPPLGAFFRPRSGRKKIAVGASPRKSRQSTGALEGRQRFEHHAPEVKGSRPVKLNTSRNVQPSILIFNF